MAFRFALAPLLRLRQGLEHQCALVLQKACFNVGRAREALDRLDRFRDDCARANSGALATGQTAAELQFAALVRDQMKQLHLRLQDEITAGARGPRSAVHAPKAYVPVGANAEAAAGTGYLFSATALAQPNGLILPLRPGKSCRAAGLRSLLDMPHFRWACRITC